MYFVRLLWEWDCDRVGDARPEAGRIEGQRLSMFEATTIVTARSTSL